MGLSIAGLASDWTYMGLLVLPSLERCVLRCLGNLGGQKEPGSQTLVEDNK